MDRLSLIFLGVISFLIVALIVLLILRNYVFKHSKIINVNKSEKVLNDILKKENITNNLINFNDFIIIFKQFCLNSRFDASADYVAWETFYSSDGVYFCLSRIFIVDDNKYYNQMTELVCEFQLKNIIANNEDNSLESYSSSIYYNSLDEFFEELKFDTAFKFITDIKKKLELNIYINEQNN